MTSAVGDPRRVRAGWTVPVIGVGVAISVAGLVVRGDAAPARTVCQVNAQVQSFMQSVSGKVGRLPGLPTKATSCAALDLRYDLGLVGALVGLVIAMAGFVWLMRRSRRAARSGAPWPIRRTLDAAARWLDARLPGNRYGAEPRIRGGFLAGLGVVLVVAAVGGAVSVWDGYQRSQQIHGYEAATTALTALQLPHGLQREPAGACGDETVCARSSLNPPQIGPFLRHLLDGAPNPSATAAIPCAGPCPVVIYGHYDGALTVGIAFWHLLIVRDGKPPRGAIPARPSIPARAGRPAAYFLGSDIDIGTVDPRQSD